MNKIIILFLTLLMSCNSIQKKAKVPKGEGKEITTELKTELENSQETDDDCVFDKKTQTDKFLYGIKELENYQWNYETRTAKLRLKNGDSLSVYRGGCNHFGVSAKMKIYSDSVDYSDWNNVNVKVLWIAKILEKEFAYKKIQTDLDSLNITIGKLGKGEIIHFSNDYLKTNNYTIYRKLDKEFDLIELSYYID